MKNKIVLGLNFSHDTSAVLIKNGQIFAAEEERWTGHNNNIGEDIVLFPDNALECCLKNSKINIEDIDEIIGVGVGEDMIYGLENINLIKNLIKSQKIKNVILKKLKFLSHHLSHAYSGIFLLNGLSYIILVIDGGGNTYKTNELNILNINNKFDFDYSLLGDKYKNTIEKISGFIYQKKKILKNYELNQYYKIVGNKILKNTNSLGRFYEFFSKRLVEKGDEAQGTMMAMSNIKKAKKYYEQIKKTIILGEKGKIDVIFSLGKKLSDNSLSIKIGKYNLNENNVKEIPFEERCKIAYAVQKVFEESVIHIVKYLQKKTKCKNLIFSGGCALNSKLNGKLSKYSGFKNVYVPPAPNDGGTALGAALYGRCEILKQDRLPTPKCTDWGPRPFEGKLRLKLNKEKYEIKKYENELKMFEQVGKYLNDDKVVCLCYGNMEFGPRALGHRSILGKPSLEVKDRINKAKRRIWFRPLAPCIIESEFKKWFNGEADYYMNKVAYGKKSKNELIKGVLHIDNSARVQLVDESNFALYNILIEFEKLNGIPILINTSLNLKGKPIARTIEQSYEILESLDFDVLCTHNHLIIKKYLLKN